MKPWYINYLGDKSANKVQCIGGGDNGWDAMHGSWNNGKGDGWAINDSPNSMAYFKRKDIPTHWDIAEGWTIADMSHQSVLGATDPNRIMWMSGSLNIPGSPTNPDGSGGMILDNSASPGCESPGLNCFPFTWKTFPEYLEDAGVSWQVWQDMDNFEDNMLAYFKQYQDAPTGSALREKGNSYPTLDKFYAAAAAGTLPQVSYIVGPQELAEHAPNMPIDGAWLQKKVVEAVANSPAFNETVLIISYDEQGGWYDHVVPEVAPKGTAGEWFQDPYNTTNGQIPMGPGPREARFIISPWTRGGNVFTEPADHTSDQQFVEAWAQANGYNVHNPAITQWRRQHMSNLVNAFDFSKEDISVPKIADVRTPEARPDNNYSGNLTLGSLTGPWVGPSKCLYNDNNPVPQPPFGKDNVNQDLSKLVEEGFKNVRGQLTEGRYLVLERNGLALANIFGELVNFTLATKDHKDIKQRWILHSVDGSHYSNNFFMQSAADKQYITPYGGLDADVSNAQVFSFDYSANGSRYSMHGASGDDRKAKKGKKGNVVSTINWTGNVGDFKIYAVSYQS